MPEPATRSCTAFDGHRLLARGPLPEVALAVKAATEAGATGPHATGMVVDLDLRGSEAEVVARLAQPSDPAEPRGRGRPKLGVIAREVTLLPRHWEWLSAQPGGASAVLRRLVDEARRTNAGEGARRAAREAAYRFMSATSGDLPGFEEAARALFAGNREAFRSRIEKWPRDMRDYAETLAFGDALVRR